MSRLSPHFTITEFVKSQTAERKGIENMPEDIPLIIAINKVDKIRTCYQKEAMYKNTTGAKSFWGNEVITKLSTRENGKLKKPSIHSRSYQ